MTRSDLSNLPPGVTESMIPGNRPEDEAEERFMEELYEHLLGVAESHQRDALAVRIDELMAEPLVERAIEFAREWGYRQ